MPKQEMVNVQVNRYMREILMDFLEDFCHNTKDHYTKYQAMKMFMQIEHESHRVGWCERMPEECSYQYNLKLFSDEFKDCINREINREGGLVEKTP